MESLSDDANIMEDMMTWNGYDFTITLLALLGIIINAMSLYQLRKKGSVFHRLLKLLALSDLLVVSGCTLLYALPDLWYYYNHSIYPVILPYLLPIVQMAMMTSIYTTIVLSFERYVRIGCICRLRANEYITEENFWLYVLGVVLFPALFYFPKFFELRTTHKTLSLGVPMDCSLIGSYLLPGLDESAAEGMSNNTWTDLGLGLSICNESQRLKPSYTETLHTVIVEATQLKENQIYSLVYCMILNTLVSLLFPLVTVFFFNLFTIKALHEIGIETHLVRNKRIRLKSSKRETTTTTEMCGSSLLSRQTKAVLSTSPGKRKRTKAEVEIQFTNVQEQQEQQQQQQSMAKAPSTPSERKRLTLRLKNEPRCLIVEQHNTTAQRSRSDSDLQHQPFAQIELGVKNKRPKIFSDSSSCLGETSVSQHEIHRDKQNGTDHHAKSFSQAEARPTASASASASSEIYVDHGGRSHENRLTRIASAIVWLFLFCHCWRLIPTLYEAFHSSYEWPTWLRHVSEISHTLIVFNSAVNFLLYKCL